jgi:hypothetical protein
VKLYWLLPSRETLSRSIVKLVGGEGHLRPRSLDLQWWFRSLLKRGIGLVILDLEQRMEVGATAHEKVIVLHFQGENSRYGLNWFCLPMSLFKILF